MLDVGSGTGHWIDFYLDVFRARYIVGLEIANPAVELLRMKYKDVQSVDIIEEDISNSEFNLGREFDIINAIGIMFHIVDDNRWKQAVKNLAGHLKNDGVIVVGGQFGLITQNVQFHNTDYFSSWDEQLRSEESDVALVNKRIRSLNHWKECARQAGLRVNCVKKTRQKRGIRTPENNVLILSHK